MALRAAVWAERHQVPLRFSSIQDEHLTSIIRVEESSEPWAVAARTGRHRFTTIPAGRLGEPSCARFTAAVSRAGIHADLEVHREGDRLRLDLLVDAIDVEPCLDLARALLPGGRALHLLATGLSSVTVVGQALPQALRERATRNVELFRSSAGGTSFLVPDAGAVGLVRMLHRALSGSATAAGETGAPIQSQQAGVYVGY
jgi:aspartokinase